MWDAVVTLRKQLNKISDIHGHLINLRGVVLFNIAENSDIVALHKVDRDTLTAETTRTADTMNVQLSIVGQIVVDD